MNRPNPAGREPVELSWQVNGLRLAGLRWGDESLPPLLALHGWLDNAESFSVLAPLLVNHCVVAPDLTGHGRSSRRSQDAGYQIWDDLPEIVGLLRQLDWPQFSLLGHSRGAIISAILASVIPERVQRLVLLDGILPPAVSEDEFPRQLGRFLEQKFALASRKAKYYPSVERAVAARSAKGIDTASAEALARRGLDVSDQGYYWNSDSRLHGASAVKLTTGQNLAVMRALQMPTLLLCPEEGMIQKSANHLTELKSSLPLLRTVGTAGGHHFHMETDVDDVAQVISGFLAS